MMTLQKNDVHYMQKNEKEAKSEADWPLVDQEPGPGSLELQIADIFVSDAKNYRW